MIKVIKSALEKGITKSIYSDNTTVDPVPSQAAKPEQNIHSGEGERIKNNIINVLNENHNKVDTKGVFDSISDSDIEKNLPTAKSIILERLNKGKETSQSLNNYPNMRDGLAMFYAASEQGDKKAAKLAYEAAYTPINKKNPTTQAVTNIKIPTVSKENKVNTVPEHKDISKKYESFKPEFKPMPDVIYGSNSKAKTNEGNERIKEISKEKDVSLEHAKIIHYSEKWKKGLFRPTWTTHDAVSTKLYNAKTYLHLKKLSYVKYYKDVVLDASEKYNLPPLLIAGVMYVEYGGDPIWFDDVAYNARRLNRIVSEWIDTPSVMNINPELTSYGNTSIQIRRAIEMLGYDNDQKHHKKSLNH